LAAIISAILLFNASAIWARAWFLISVFAAPSKIAADFAFFAFSDILIFSFLPQRHKDTKFFPFAFFLLPFLSLRLGIFVVKL
jgi:hypothetical protein